MDDGPPQSTNGERRPYLPMPPRRRRAPTLILILVLAVGIAIAASRHHSGSATTPPSKPSPTGVHFGANTGLLFNSRSNSPATIADQLDALKATGATVARADAPWEATEPTAPSGSLHHYDWAFDDLVAASLATAGLNWLPVIDYSAPWARSLPSQDHSAPDAAEYAAYAAQVAARYGTGGTFWQAHPQLPAHPVQTYEIWNEPDNPFFWSPHPDAAAYADLYLRARDAIDAVQPDARVIVGGLTHPATFLPGLLAAAPALHNELDGVAIHPYGANPQAILDKVRAARAALGSLGLATVPLYVTEVGWTTSPPGALDYLSAHLRPGYLQQTLTELGHTGCGLGGVFVYAWVTPERNPSDPQDWFGIHPPTGGTSPDTVAFTQGLRAATTAGTPATSC